MCIFKEKQKWAKKKKKKKQEGKDYFGISLYRQEDIAVVVLFADNLGREETYTHTSFTLVFHRFF